MTMTTLQRVATRRVFQCVAVVVAMLVAAGYAMWPAHAQTNLSSAENALGGNLAGEWDIAGSGDASIQGFATVISVNNGATVSFKINNDESISIDVYRFSYCSGADTSEVA